jgi:hypothetical protein
MRQTAFKLCFQFQPAPLQYGADPVPALQRRVPDLLRHHPARVPPGAAVLAPRAPHLLRGVVRPAGGRAVILYPHSVPVFATSSTAYFTVACRVIHHIQLYTLASSSSLPLAFQASSDWSGPPYTTLNPKPQYLKTSSVWSGPGWRLLARCTTARCAAQSSPVNPCSPRPPRRCGDLLPRRNGPSR